MLGIFVRCEEGYFDVGAVLLFCDATFFECSVEVVDYLLAIGIIVMRALVECLDEEVAEFLHDGECDLALAEDEWVSIEVGEVEEKRFEKGLFDDCLEFFETLARSF